MTILKGTDLGTSFERLKTSMREADKIMQSGDTAGAYAKLFVNTEHFVKEFDDSPDDLPSGLFQALNLPE